jgi:hypothetical protein
MVVTQGKGAGPRSNRTKEKRSARGSHNHGRSSEARAVPSPLRASPFIAGVALGERGGHVYAATDSQIDGFALAVSVDRGDTGEKLMAFGELHATSCHARTPSRGRPLDPRRFRPIIRPCQPRREIP